MESWGPLAEGKNGIFQNELLASSFFDHRDPTMVKWLGKENLLLAQKPWIVPIPGTTQMAHMLENNGADDIRFTTDELTSFGADLAKIEIKGLRLPQMVLNFSGVEAPPKK